jgi:hypothetical protein
VFFVYNIFHVLAVGSKTQTLISHYFIIFKKYKEKNLWIKTRIQICFSVFSIFDIKFFSFFRSDASPNLIGIFKKFKNAWIYLKNLPEKQRNSSLEPIQKSLVFPSILGTPKKLFFSQFFLGINGRIIPSLFAQKPRKSLTNQTFSLRLLHSDQTNLKFQLFAAPNSTFNF